VVTVKVLAALVLVEHPLSAVTLRVPPEVQPQLTVIEVVPAPAVMVPPAGSVHV